ncbi:hypothetical protein [Paramicrobacterium agarici]|uniref:hypothetical protein n=1 Tax=Paramicrobacterium agarici TaxID=630514 RepID=UPI00114EC727|nr:hypothetical protein [Microbacterium agarici]TQO24245.1 hypothetical protein FB385_3125 [Microbacterium agarici]
MSSEPFFTILVTGDPHAPDPPAPGRKLLISEAELHDAITIAQRLYLQQGYAVGEVRSIPDPKHVQVIWDTPARSFRPIGWLLDQLTTRTILDRDGRTISD